MALRTRTPRARAILPATRSRSSGPLGALLSSPALDVRLITALQVLQVLVGLSGCQRCCQAAVCVLSGCVGQLSGCHQAVTLGPDSDGTPLMSGSAVRLSDTCCRCRALSGAVRGLLSGCQTRDQGQGSAVRPGATTRSSRASAAGAAPASPRAYDQVAGQRGTGHDWRGGRSTLARKDGAKAVNRKLGCGVHPWVPRPSCPGTTARNPRVKGAACAGEASPWRPLAARCSPRQ